MMFTFRHINRAVYPTKHILVCEDNLQNQELIAKHLKELFGDEQFVQCSFVCGGLQASSILHYCKVDLILLDHDMPSGNGIDLMNWMKTYNCNVPVITFSGIPQNNVMLMKAGANYLFSKHEVINGKADNLIKSILGV